MLSRKLFVQVSLLSLAALVPVGFAAEAPATLPAKSKFQLYLLIGQSNMAGRGALDDDAKTPHPRVLKFTKENAWAPAVEPLHFDKPIAGVGIGGSFGREMAGANPDATIGLIPCAVGGTPLSRWQKGGDLYQQAVVRAKLAMKDGALFGVLWHQGENDAGKKDTAENYAARLAQMVKDLRAEFGISDLPFVAGKLGEFLPRTDKDGQPSYWPVVNEQIATLPSLVPRTMVVESTGLKHKGDGIHFDTPSLREFGKRYATAMRAMWEK
ncbi:MAG: sialate O-acetylesterase [Verrucomicrobia bacterium]|nr:sialate O-acetylesterase [Verrucomicrobiota bacterium]